MNPHSYCLGLVVLFLTCVPVLPAQASAELARTLRATDARGPAERAEAQHTKAITFNELSTTMVGVINGAVAWGDQDGDGDLDILLTGYTGGYSFSAIYGNQFGTNFVDIGASLAQVSNSGAAWGDYDNDGDLDVLLAGSGQAAVYRNDGGGAFVDIVAGLPGLNFASVAWGDCDNDGDLDFALTGRTGGGTSQAYVFRNDGGDTFVDLAAGLQGLGEGSVAWGDYDNDGDLDLAMTGLRGTFPAYIRESLIYRNEGDGVFLDIGAGLPGVVTGSAVWGDYDNDGDLDLILTGDTGAGKVGAIYRNEGGGTFTDAAAGLPAVSYSAAAWGDYDNDGDADLLLSGDTGAGYICRVYRNDGSNVFTDIAAGLPGLYNASVAWGDYDNDGDLDILFAGSVGAQFISRVYRSDGGTANTPPPAPTGLSAAVSGQSVTLSWTGSADAQTPLAGLSYNLRVGSSPGGGQVVSPMANAVTGHRLVPQTGNAQQRTSWTLKLPPGLYYWSVQEVDGAYAGSGFASEGNFFVIAFTDIEAGLPGVADGAVAWGDYDGDGDLDFVLTGYTGAVRISRIYRNDGGGVFVDIGAGLPNVRYSAVAWGDYDNDGDLDLVLAGDSGGVVAAVYRNDGPGGFVDIGAGLPAVYYAAVAWGDYDNDGDLDLALAGNTGVEKLSRVYRNDGSDTFTDIGAGLPGIADGSLAWGDYDGDGDLDLAMTGLTSGGFTRIYRNDGGGNFVDINAGLPDVYFSAAPWGDYDNDGDLDLLLTGWTGGAYLARVYRNDGGFFTDIAAGLPGVYWSTGGWGDFDNDGDLDILLPGNAASGYEARIFRNDGGTFSPFDAGLPGVGWSGAAWGDYDNDGDLDILLTGSTGPTRVTSLYRNDGPPANTPPSAPDGLTALAATSDVTFMWNASADAQTPAAGLTYNLRIGTTPGGDEIMSAMSDGASGFRRVVGLGNVQHHTSWTVTLPNGSFYWSVQAIDGAFQGSPFAIEDGVVPVLASLVSVDAQADCVRLTWYAATAGAAAVTVYRCTAGTEWTVMGEAIADGTGYLRYEDTSVQSGERYGYRLALVEAGRQVFVGETWVEVPGDVLDLTLEGVRPNPARRGDLTVHFVLPNDCRARLEVLDVNGRRITQRDADRAGRHVVNFGQHVDLAPGVYLIRLSGAGKVLTTRAIVLR